MPPNKVLSENEVNRYRQQGYLTGYPVFGEDELVRLRTEFERLLALVPEGMKADEMCQWHGYDRFLYDLCMAPRLLDYVEDLIGPDFFLWGTHFLAKQPRDPTPVLWHQDAFYWALDPKEAVSVWVAFTDSVQENGCLRVVPGTHRAGLLKHRVSDNAQPQGLWLQMEEGEFNPEEAVSLALKAGQISLHDNHIVHGSQGNRTDRWRIGLSIRYSPTHVRCDLQVWPTFVAFLARGRDRLGLNPPGAPPPAPLRHFVYTIRSPEGEEVRDKLLAQATETK